MGCVVVNAVFVYVYVFCHGEMFARTFFNTDGWGINVLSVFGLSCTFLCIWLEGRKLKVYIACNPISFRMQEKM